MNEVNEINVKVQKRLFSFLNSVEISRSRTYTVRPGVQNAAVALPTVQRKPSLTTLA